jgi:hypothetical protein
MHLGGPLLTGVAIHHVATLKDYLWEQASKWYNSLDVLIAAINKDGRVNVQCSVLNRFIIILHSRTIGSHAGSV